MNLHEKIKYSAIYGGLAGILMSPISVLYIYFASIIYGVDPKFIVAKPLESLMQILLLGIGGGVCGLIFGLVYNSILLVIIKLSKSQLGYHDICKHANYVAYYLLGIDIALMAIFLLALAQDQDGFGIGISWLSGLICWTPLIPFIFLNHKLSTSDSDTKKK